MKTRVSLYFRLLLALLACLPAMVFAVPPSITGQPVSRTTSSNISLSFSVSATGTPPLTVQWRLNGVNIPGASHVYSSTNSITDSYSLQNVATEDGGRYNAVVFNSEGAVTSSSADCVVTNLGILPISDTFNINPNLLPQVGKGILGRTNNFNATPDAFEPRHGGKPGKHSVWVGWKAPFTGIATFDTAGSGFDTTLGVYTATGSGITSLSKVAGDDDRGGFLRSRVQFNIVANTIYFLAIDGFYESAGNICLRWDAESTSDKLPEIFAQSGDITTGNNGSATLTVAFKPPTSGYEFQWYRNGQPINGQTGTNLVLNTVASNNVGVYFLQTVATSQGTPRTNLSDSIQLQINILNGGGPDTNAVAQTKFRDESDTGIGVLAAAPASGYSGSQIFSTYGAVKEPGEPNHCGEAGGASYWFSYQAPADGALTVDANASFNSVLATYIGDSVTNFNSLTNLACSSTNGAAGHEVSVFNVTNGTTYYLVSDGVGGASGTINLNYALAALPAVSGQPGGLTVNLTSNASFSISAVGNPTLKYQWRHNVTNNVLNATNATLNLTNCQSTNAGNYTCVVTNTYGKTTSSVATLTVRLPIVISNQPVSLGVLQGSNAQFSVVAGGTSPAYQWKFFVTNSLPGATNATLTVTNAQSTNAGDYTVVITNAVNALTSSVATLTVNIPPTITNQPASQTVVLGSNVSLTVGASGSTPLRYQWRANNTAMNGRTNNPLSLTNFQAANELSYDVVVTNSYGMVTSSSAFLYLIPSNAASRFTNLSYQTNTYIMTLLGTANSNYVTLFSTNTTNWAAVRTNSSSVGIIPLAISNSIQASNALFRARTP